MKRFRASTRGTRRIADAVSSRDPRDEAAVSGVAVLVLIQTGDDDDSTESYIDLICGIV
jgi:hypothetical protein